MNRAALKTELIRDEGLKLAAYKDSLGFWTIGVGHLLGSKPRMTEINVSEAYALLEADIDEAERRAERFLGGAVLDDVRMRAIVNMAFNLGGKLYAFEDFQKAVKAGDWEKAGAEMSDSKWSGQVGERAVRLRNMIEVGEV